MITHCKMYRQLEKEGVGRNDWQGRTLRHPASTVNCVGASANAESADTVTERNVNVWHTKSYTIVLC